ncbi:hypothetical protein QN277_025346 [Acacia crassicarpa]|uniref:Cytochrome P450 n=1 Tax=Acacia crassicarpa TaxID=499986 RepID=A0AAE1MKG4_9FABA|nr:hypothetical protein QN277_025346 [Acacia crassicarpa]
MLLANVTIPIALLFTFSFLYRALFLLLKQRKLHHEKPPPPPGPQPLPLIGNLHILGKSPHRTLQSLAKTYGPIMSLKFGQVPAIVISSSEAAQLILKTNDIVFSIRPRTQASGILTHGFKGVAFADYGLYWRHVKKLITVKLLSPTKMEFFASMMREELSLVVKSFEKASSSKQIVDLSEAVHNLMEDIAFKMNFGSHTGKDTEFNYKKLVREAMNLLGTFNVSDYLPCLRPFDLQGIKRQLKKCMKEGDEILEKMMKESEQAQKKSKDQNHNSFIDTLVSQMNQSIGKLQDGQELVLDPVSVKAIISDLFSPVVEGSTIVVEWVLSELIRNQRVMKKLQHEIQNVVGMKRMVEETDLSELSYLDLVIKESLRLHPPGSFNPREAREDIIMDGYYIKKKTLVLINTWSIGRDPKAWSDDVDIFYPERFLNSEVDLKGHHFQLLPFGSGRRRCAGIRIALTLIKFVVAQFVHYFDWELPYGIKYEELDMEEKYAFPMPRARHLLAIPSRRLPN